MTNTVLTVFENSDTLNEPVISLPMIGRMSFRQIGIIMGLAVMLPMAIYSAGSDAVLDVHPEPVLSFDSVGVSVKITWDVILAVLPIPVGLALGIPRPKLVPMDVLVVVLFKFMIYHTSVRPDVVKTRPPKRPHTSAFAGFARRDDSVRPESRSKDAYTVTITDLGIPKNLTITLYDSKGSPIRHRLVRVYIDGDLLSSITTDSDGVIGMTFVPHSEGQKRLEIFADGEKIPIVDSILDVQKHR